VRDSGGNLSIKINLFDRSFKYRGAAGRAVRVAEYGVYVSGFGFLTGPHEFADSQSFNRPVTTNRAPRSPTEKPLKIMGNFADNQLDIPEINKRKMEMETEDFLRVINEFDFVRDDIIEIKEHLKLTASEDKKISEAIMSLEAAKNILAQLLPSIKSLDVEVREDLAAELIDEAYLINETQ
jgi:hypothetical protein